MFLLCPDSYGLQKENITKEKKKRRKREKHCSKIKDCFKFFLQWDSPQIKRNLFFTPSKVPQSSPCFHPVLHLCIGQHLKLILFQIWWVSLFWLVLWLFVSVSIILDCPGLVDRKLMPMQCLFLNLLFLNSALICTGMLLRRYQARTDRPGLRTDRRWKTSQRNSQK